MQLCKLVSTPSESRTTLGSIGIHFSAVCIRSPMMQHLQRDTDLDRIDLTFIFRSVLADMFSCCHQLILNMLSFLYIDAFGCSRLKVHRSVSPEYTSIQRL